MTRLKDDEISGVLSHLEAYNQDLLRKTGSSLLGIACEACKKSQILIWRQMTRFTIHVVPITAGQGIITGFSETVCGILQFLGFNAKVSPNSDASGIALAFESKADAIMMADDNAFVGLQLQNRLVVDNSTVTGRVFACALNLMAKGIRGRKVLVMGCGPVGEAASRALLSWGAEVALSDVHLSAATFLQQRLSAFPGGDRIVVEEAGTAALSHYKYIIEATPQAGTIPDEFISHQYIAAPGVPLGISSHGSALLKNRLIHDKLELGVAAMAVELLP